MYNRDRVDLTLDGIKGSNALASAPQREARCRRMTRLLLSAVAAVMAQASNCSLSDPEHLRLAATLRDATRGCDVVVFTTVAYSSRALLPSPATRLTEAAVDNAACYVVVAHGGAAFCGSVEPWRIVEAGGVPGRRASRAVKLRPLLFFPDARHIVFLDWKLRLKRTPASLIRATVGSGPFGFAAFRHPCTAAYTPRGMKPCPQRRPNEAWWRAEARDVLRRGGTEDAAALRRQVERYERAGPLVEYADGALLAWDAAHPVASTLSCAWWAEYARDDSSDRDQLAFARALTTVLAPDSSVSPAKTFQESTRRDGVFLVSEGGGRRGACGGLCHQSDTTSTFVESVGTRVLALGTVPGC